MNILFCVFTYYPNKDGVQTVTQYQAEGLAKLGHMVTIITSNHKNHEKVKEVHNGVKIIRIDAYTDNMLDYGNKKEYQKLLIEQSKNNDVVICVCPESWPTNWAIPVQKYIKCKKIMIIHGMHEFNMTNMRFNIFSFTKKIIGNIRWGIFYKKNMKNIKNFDAFIHLHEKDYSYQYFLKKKTKNNFVLYNAVEKDFFIDNVKKDNIIINVGTYCKNKNQLECLDVFYKSSLKDYKLILIGNQKNEYYKELVKRKEELDKIYGNRKVDIYANLDRKTTVNLIKSAKIYLLTSFSEKFPVSLLEAMASKCAFVSTDVGVVKYLSGGIVGKTEEELIKALNLFSNPENLEKYSTEGYQFAEENSRIDTQVKRLEEILKQVIEK